MTEEERKVLLPAKTFLSSHFMAESNKIYISDEEAPTVVVRISLLGVTQDHNNFVQFVKAVRSKVPPPYRVKFKLTFCL